VRNGTGEILTRLRDAGPLSRAELARQTRISSAGVTKITAQLHAAGLVGEYALQGHSVGRPPVSLSLNPDAYRVLAIHLGAGQAQVALFDLMLNGGPVRSAGFDLSDPTESIIDVAVRLSNEVIQEASSANLKILGVGVGVPGSVDDTKRINIHSVLAGWKNVAFAQAFESLLGLPVVIEHNATAIAMAEARYGDGREAESILHLFLGQGLGAGFAQTGPGERCSPVEIGHVAVNPGGPSCRCGGHGCLERYFSEQPLRQLVGDPDIARPDLVAAAMRTDDWPTIYEYLLQALSTTVTLLGPERVVLGGDLNTAPDAFLNDLRRDLAPRVMPQQRERLKLGRTSLPGPAGASGAACVALESFFYSGGPAFAQPMSQLAPQT